MINQFLVPMRSHVYLVFVAIPTYAFQIRSLAMSLRAAIPKLTRKETSLLPSCLEWDSNVYMYIVHVYVHPTQGSFEKAKAILGVHLCLCLLVVHVYILCASGDWLTSRPKGCLQPRELWFFDILMVLYI